MPGGNMEFLTRSYFSLWTFAVLTLVTALIKSGMGLQGIPTWICLGLKSPFIEFRNEIEILANNSIALNITKDEQALMHQEGLRKLGTFIKPVDLRDSTTGYVKANLTKKIPSPSEDSNLQRRVHPIQEEMDLKQIILLDEDTDENGLPASLTDEDRRFIVPMALKNAAPDASIVTTSQRTTPTTQTKTTTPRIMTTTTTPEFASNIDDLKKHILFLQNLTKHDSNFQSKFVVFPSLHKNTPAGISTTTIRPERSFFQYSASPPPPTRKLPLNVSVPGGQGFGGYYHNDDDDEHMSVFLTKPITNPHEKITIVPQVMLLNDQTSDKNNPYKDSNDGSSQRRNLNEKLNHSMLTTESTIFPVNSTTRRATKKPPCLRNPDSPKCIRQRKREELQRQRDREQLLREQQEHMQPHFEPFVQTINNTKRFAVSIELPDSFKQNFSQRDSTEKLIEDQLNEPKLLLRSARSHHKRRNIGGGLQGRSNEKILVKYGTTYFDRDAVLSSGGRDFLLSSVDGLGLLPNGSTPSPTVAAYSEEIDLNPDNCYQVDGMSYGQKKMCILQTSVMPAISRGARAAIQECQFQFKKRRWNCSNSDDSTVFGPMTSIGSPEMAFVHALAAATVTSFIARACRDGQLTSCGCSRGSRPKQLHDDWTWGGCGDNLEYAYKFATDFIDIREKETKRGTRGVGHPERKRIRLNQKRNQQKRQMLADDSAAILTLTDVNANPTPRTTKLSPENNCSRTAVAGEVFNNDKNKKKCNKTIKNDGNSNKAGSVLSERAITTSFPLLRPSSVAPPPQEESYEEDISNGRIQQEDLLELQERITKEILNSKLHEDEMIKLQEKINREILNSKVFNTESKRKRKRKNQRAVNGISVGDEMSNSGYDISNGGNPGGGAGVGGGKWKNTISTKARSLMNLHNNEAGRRAVIKKTRITCKCHGVSGSCSLITCWQQLSSVREIGDYLRVKYEESTEVKLNKRGRLQVKDPQFKVPTAHDLVYLDESPDWCRNNRQLHWPGTHGRVCNKSSSGLDGCGILCCGRGYNTKNIVVRERCNCKFHWCCQVKCDVCVKVLEEHTCK